MNSDFIRFLKLLKLKSEQNNDNIHIAKIFMNISSLIPSAQQTLKQEMRKLIYLDPKKPNPPIQILDPPGKENDSL